MSKADEIKKLEEQLKTLKEMEETKTEQQLDGIPVRCKIVAYVTKDGEPIVKVEGDIPSAAFLADYTKKYFDILVEENIRARLREQESKKEANGDE